MATLFCTSLSHRYKQQATGQTVDLCSAKVSKCHHCWKSQSLACLLHAFPTLTCDPAGKRVALILHKLKHSGASAHQVQISTKINLKSSFSVKKEFFKLLEAK